MNSRLSMMREEYIQLRAESQDAIKHRTQVAAFALAAVGALFAGALAAEPDKNVGLVLLVFSVGVPIGLSLSFLIWFGEVERMIRASNYLTLLETEINLQVRSSVLRWEQWLRTPSQQMGYSYVAGAALLLGPAVMMPIVGFEATGTEYADYWCALVLPMVFPFAAAGYAGSRARQLRSASESAASGAREPGPARMAPN